MALRPIVSSTAGRALALTYVAAVIGIAGCGGSTSSAGSAGSLQGSLSAANEVVSQMQGVVPGLSPQQMAQGMGGILGYAKTKMSPGQFAGVAGAFPGSNAMISEGTKLGMPSEMTGLSSLSGTLSKAGISQEQFSQMVPAMTDIVTQKAGPDIGQAFAAAFH
jgi:hypothetical protein